MNKKIKIFIVVLLLFTANHLTAQGTLRTTDGGSPTGGGFGQVGNQSQRGSDTSFKHRDDRVDSITISYRYYDRNKTLLLDSSISDFYTRFPLPYHYKHLGNLATAATSFLFNPQLQVGFDPGFHQFDAYNYTLENTKLFHTTKPYTELTYLLGSTAEQTINVLHTQNKKDNLNYSLEYRFINSPGVFKNQNASVNNTRFVLQYQSPNKRFHLTTIYIANKNAASENGGTVNYKLLDSLALNNPFELAVRLGIGGVVRRNLFNTTVNTGNIYTQSHFIVKSQYDLGQKDSIVTDTSNIKLFYPKLRLQHLLSLKSNSYLFKDAYADSTKYSNYFDYKIKGNTTGNYDTIAFKDSWSIIDNEFSLISFPDKKNASQFIKASATYQNIIGTFNDSIKHRYYNIFIGGEYRNRTKNRVWDMEAKAQLHLSGYNAGDYLAYISLQKLLSKKVGTLQIGFQNTNKSPSFIYNTNSSFRVTNRTSYNKENTTKIWGNYFNKQLDLSLTGEYFLMSNYLYFNDFFKAQQEPTLFNVLHIELDKKIKLRKHINLYSEIHFQQITANAPINIPQVFTRQRIAFEGNFYTNLFLSTGLEFKYHSKYKPAAYSPMNGQFFYQNNYSLWNKPEINFFFNFRIKSFKAFLRAENLNTIFTSGYESYNYSTEQYPMQSLWMRFGIWWEYVN
jgi:hypothetical protein